MDGETDGQTGARKIGQTDGNGQTDGLTDKSERQKGRWIETQTDRLVDGRF